MKPIKIILLEKSLVRVVYDNWYTETKMARGIMMKSWGIDATLRGDKTVTRRIIKIPSDYYFLKSGFFKYIFGKNGHLCQVNCKQGKPGDLLYIRENYNISRERATTWLLIVNIRVERLQDITEEDAKREGAPWQTYNIAGYDVFSWFREEWDKINANKKDKEGNILPYSWEHNPWMFVIDYRLFFQGKGESA